MILIQMHFPGPDIKAWDSHIPNWAAEYKGGLLQQQQQQSLIPVSILKVGCNEHHEVVLRLFKKITSQLFNGPSASVSETLEINS